MIKVRIENGKIIKDENGFEFMPTPNPVPDLEFFKNSVHYERIVTAVNNDFNLVLLANITNTPLQINDVVIQEWRMTRKNDNTIDLFLTKFEAESLVQEDE